jgi:L-ribulose-5-phosphate 3-epimerase
VKRRTLLVKAAQISALSLIHPLVSAGSGGAKANKGMFFDISLAQWSLHRQFKGGLLDPLDFAETAKKRFDINAIEYVNQFFKDKARDQKYINTLKQRAADNGVESLLIMVDGEGKLADTNNQKRLRAVENHYQWVDAAKRLGCHSIRVNAAGKGLAEEVKLAAIDGLGKLAEFAKDFKINIIVENHGGYSSDGAWLSDVLGQVNLSNCGSLPDFGNFKEYDRYLGVKQLMPFAKGVSAKSYTFDKKGDETTIDYLKMLNIVKAAGYRGHIGIEFEGDIDSPRGEDQGVLATKALLERIGVAIARSF